MTIPIPDRMKHLKTWRGQAVPITVVWKEDKPLFSINNGELQERLAHEERCSVCGNQLFRGRWLVGGPLSAFHPNGHFLDSAMHAECMRYSLQICPYLAAPNYSGVVGPAMIERHGKDIGRRAIPEEFIDTPETVLVKDRPKLFVAVMTTRGVEISPSNGSSKPGRPYSVVEFWRDGVQLKYLDGIQIIADQYPGLEREAA